MLPFTFESEILSWVLTYALHSSALLCAAWLVTRRRRAGSERMQELVWKTALVGGLVTASVQVGLDVQPLAGRFALETSARAARVDDAEFASVARMTELAVSTELADNSQREAPPSSATEPVVPARARAPREVDRTTEEVLSLSVGPEAQRTSSRRRSTPAPVDIHVDRQPERESPPVLAAAAAEAPPPRSIEHSAASLASSLTTTLADWSELILAAWIVGGALGVLLLALALTRLADHLAGRRTVNDGALHELFVALCARAGVARVPRLCVSARLDSPATVGVLAPVVCVPVRALDELAPEHQEAMLAHELAHVARRDPQWAFLARLLERALFFQPLNGLARRRLAVLSEYLADEWAVEQTGRGLSLARCLTEVAGWVLERRARVGVLPMASPGSLLGDRVRRLLAAEVPTRRARRSRTARALRVVPAIAFVGGVAFVLPGAAARAGEPLVAAPRHAEPVPEPAPHEAPQPPVMEALFDELDGEFDELLADIDALEGALEEGELTDSFAQPVAVLRGRLTRLRESKTRLDALAPIVMQLLEEERRATAASTEPDLPTDSSRPRSEP